MQEKEKRMLREKRREKPLKTEEGAKRQGREKKLRKRHRKGGERERERETKKE